MRTAKGGAARLNSARVDANDDLGAVIEALHVASAHFPVDVERAAARRPLPSRESMAAILDDLRAVLFPAHFDAPPFSRANARYALGARLDRVEQALAEQAWRGFGFTCDHVGNRDKCGPCAERGREVARALVLRLPAVRALLESDVRAAYEGDPAATFIDETLLCYPGVSAIVQHRIAHELHRLGVPVVPRIVADLSRASTGIDIHPGAEIGASFFIDHGTGVVIGETCAIGARVRLYQGVTLGARGFRATTRAFPSRGCLGTPSSRTTSSSTPARRSWAASRSARAPPSAGTCGSRATSRPARA